jgi:hypothetical protein
MQQANDLNLLMDVPVEHEVILEPWNLPDTHTPQSRQRRFPNTSDFRHVRDTLTSLSHRIQKAQSRFATVSTDEVSNLVSVPLRKQRPNGAATHGIPSTT